MDTGLVAFVPSSLHLSVYWCKCWLLASKALKTFMTTEVLMMWCSEPMRSFLVHYILGILKKKPLTSGKVPWSLSKENCHCSINCHRWGVSRWHIVRRLRRHIDRRLWSLSKENWRSSSWGHYTPSMRNLGTQALSARSKNQTPHSNPNKKCTSWYFELCQ
jgi:hypothetical protein